MTLLRRIALLLVLVAPPGARAQDTVTTEHARATLLVSHERARPGDDIWAALKIELDPGWHTYWRNPGDSGLPGAVSWTLPPGVSAGDIAWPVPARIPYGTLVNFGYDGVVVLPVPVRIAADAAPGRVVLDASATWLVCAEICIPADGTFKVALELGPTLTPAAASEEIDRALAAMPRPAPWPVQLERSAGGIVVRAGPGVDLQRDVPITYFPFDGGLIDNAAPQQMSRAGDSAVVRVAAAPTPLDLPAQTGGLLVLGDGADRAAYSFTAPAPTAAAATPANDVSLWAAVVLAFLGGLILNLMPCVLPVLAMKALAFTAQGENAAERRRDGLAYTLGVLVTFAGLALVLVALRAAGADVGWGFQLQSPAFVAAVAYLFLALGLNLSGAFTIGAGVMGLGETLTRRSGAAGAFFTGALAVIVATPCTAPLMGAAVGYAVTQPPLITLAVFEAVALGLAAPFLLFSFVPQAARLLPRPGPWMTRLKQFLAFPMYASAAWLVWVLSQQLGPDLLAAALAGAVLIALAAWLWGVAQEGGAPGVSHATAALALIGAAALVLAISRAPDAADMAARGASAGAETYTPQRVAQLQREGRPVFVNFTAAWCITCLMNERVALSTQEVKRAFADNNVAYLKADWTNRDGEIAKALAAFGRSGVPLYLYYAPAAASPVILPQLLTPALVRETVTPPAPADSKG